MLKFEKKKKKKKKKICVRINYTYSTDDRVYFR